MNIDAAYALYHCRREMSPPGLITHRTALVMRGSEDARRTSAYARMMLTTKVRHLALLESAGL
jgi:hypothetical protein